jgi:probable HAF family extracellular repeat protein
MTSALARSYPPFPFTAAAPASAPRLYTLVDLGTHADGAPLLPVAINDHGEICVSAACARPPGLVRAFCWRQGERTPAGIAFGQAPAVALSNEGHLAGVTGTAPRALRAWASHRGNFGEELWPDSVSAARGVNAAGQLVGNVLFDAGEFSLSRAFVLGAGGGPARFLTPPQGGTTIATGINDAGDVVFNAAPLGAPAGETRAWCLHENFYVAIASLGGGRAWATAITPQGRVVGHSLTAEGETHAFLWEDGHTTDLSALPGTMSQALAANDARTVVGRVVEAQAGARAFRWTPDTGMIALEEIVAAPSGWLLREAVGINREGAIVGVGDRDGLPRGFLLQPAARP